MPEIGMVVLMTLSTVWLCLRCEDAELPKCCCAPGGLCCPEPPSRTLVLSLHGSLQKVVNTNDGEGGGEHVNSRQKFCETRLKENSFLTK